MWMVVLHEVEVEVEVEVEYVWVYDHVGDVRRGMQQMQVAVAQVVVWVSQSWVEGQSPWVPQ